MLVAPCAHEIVLLKETLLLWAQSLLLWQRVPHDTSFHPLRVRDEPRLVW
jgi:hypothetical protein